MGGGREGGVALVSAAPHGDQRALEALYDAYAAGVLGYVRGLGVPDPEDTVSEVFVSVVRGLANFRGDEADFPAWLFTIAHRRAVDAHRRRGQRRGKNTEPTLPPPPRAGPGPPPPG